MKKEELLNYVGLEVEIIMLNGTLLADNKKFYGLLTQKDNKFILITTYCNIYVEPFQINKEIKPEEVEKIIVLKS